MFLDIFASMTKRSLLLSSDECSYSEKRDLENEQQILASYMRARTGDLGPGPATARRADSDTRCRWVSHMIAWRLYAIPDRLQYSRLAIHTSIVCTILGGLYNSRVASLQFSGGYTPLDLPYHARPAMQFSTGHAIIYRRANVPRARVPRANVPRASVQRVNVWNNCVTYIIPPAGHMKLHTNYIPDIKITYELHTNCIPRPELHM